MKKQFLFIILSGCHPGSYVPAPRYGARMIFDPIEPIFRTLKTE